jgi:Domain of unknown function (DUF6487)
MTDPPTTMADQCPQCNGTMEEGFIIGGPAPVGWFEGLPQYGFAGGLKRHRVRQIKMVAIRCNDCGFVELYAPETDRT